MKFFDIVKNEIKSYKKIEIYFLIFFLFVVFFNAFFLKDNIFSIINAIFGMLYTINAGKGKINCYYYGLIGSIAYSILAYQNAFWGNFFLWLVYYIPSEILGIFLWKKNLKSDKKTIVKVKLNKSGRAKLFLLIMFFIIVIMLILRFFKDSNPFFDSCTTVLSIFGMYLTLKRAIEQWYVWLIVNILSCIMWFIAYLNGVKIFSTVLVWLIYIVISIYFLNEWKKEIN